MEDHYDSEDTQTIKLHGSTPMMNTFSFHTALMAPEFFTGKVHVDQLGGKCMNIAFNDKEEPDLSEGQVAEWCLDDETYQVRVIRRKRFFIKGVYVVLFVVQLKE